MSVTDQIYVATRRSPAEVADMVAGRLELERLRDEDGDPYLYRVSSHVPARMLAGTVYENDEEPDLAPEDVAVYDGYPVEIRLRHNPPGEEALHVESRRFFEDLAKVSDAPLLYIQHDSEVLVAAHRPSEDIVWFPPGTSTGAPGHDQWAPFALDRHALTT